MQCSVVQCIAVQCSAVGLLEELLAGVQEEQAAGCQEEGMTVSRWGLLNGGEGREGFCLLGVTQDLRPKTGWEDPFFWLGACWLLAARWKKDMGPSSGAGCGADCLPPEGGWPTKYLHFLQVFNRFKKQSWNIHHTSENTFLVVNIFLRRYSHGSTVYSHVYGTGCTSSMWLFMWKQHLGQCNVTCVKTVFNDKKKPQDTRKKAQVFFWFLLKISTFQTLYINRKIKKCDQFFRYSHYCLESLRLSVILVILIALVSLIALITEGHLEGILRGSQEDIKGILRGSQKDFKGTLREPWGDLEGTLSHLKWLSCLNSGLK